MAGDGDRHSASRRVGHGAVRGTACTFIRRPPFFSMASSSNLFWFASAIEGRGVKACRSKSGSQTFCSCYANAFADSVSIQELKEMSAIGNQEAEVTALRPKIEAATRRCSAN